MHPQLQAINDVRVKFADLNGSSTASANELFVKTTLRMGVPVSLRSYFPSDSQGLPTWYEVRVTERSWPGRLGGVDLMVVMNPHAQYSERFIADAAQCAVSRSEAQPCRAA